MSELLAVRPRLVRKDDLSIISVRVNYGSCFDPTATYMLNWRLRNAVDVRREEQEQDDKCVKDGHVDDGAVPNSCNGPSEMSL